MDKIYSRKRFLLPKLKMGKAKNLKFNLNTNNSGNDKYSKKCDYKSLRKLAKTMVIVLIAVCIANRMLCSIEPIINASSKEMAKSIATKISNEQATIVMRKICV